nr:MAG: VP2 [Norovirus sp.]
MATDVLSSLFGGAVSAAISTGAQAALQDQAYRQNLDLQTRSFQHDADMLQRQVAATQSARSQWMNFQRDSLISSGFSPADATRLTLGASPTTLVDWNGTRLAAPNATRTTSFSGGFLPISSAASAPQRSNSSVASSPLTATTRVSSWLSSVEPFLPGSLQTTWVTPPGSTSTSVFGSTSSRGSSSSGASYTSSFNQGWFNTHRMPLFSNRGR